MLIHRSELRKVCVLGFAGLLLSSMLFPVLPNHFVISKMSVFAILSCVGLFVSAGALSFAAKKVQKRKLVLFMTVFVLLFCVLINFNVRPSSGLGEPWWNSDWAYRKKGVIWHTKVAADLTNFPVLISLTDSDLASRAQTNGGDIVFTDQSGTKLDHEIEFFNHATGNLIAWVKFTLSSTVDTQFFIYYGNLTFAQNQQNAAGVWDPNFLAVHHLEEKAGNAADSTVNHNDAIATQVTTYGAPGKIGSAIEFRGANDFIQLPQVCSTETRFTFSAWISASVGARYFISQWTNNRGAFLQVYGNTVELYINGLRAATKPITLNEWHYVVGTFDGTTARLYVDGGSPSSASASSLSWPSQSMFLGDRSDHTRKYKGFLDEVRVSNVARSASWIATEYNNQLNPSAFLSIQYEDIPMLSDPKPADGATHVGFNPVLSINATSAGGDMMRIVFMSNTSGVWEELGTYTGGSGVYNQTTTNMNKFETKYWWKACVQDSKIGLWVNKTFQFTSISMLELKWVADVPAGGSNQLQPVIGDINGDGQMEVVMSGNGVVVALNGTDGVELWRYPVGVHRAAILVDLTNDGIPEVLAPQGDYKGADRIFALFGNGTLYWRSPVLSGVWYCDFPITAYDIDGDGYPAIYVATEDVDLTTNYGRLTMLNHKGEVLASTYIHHPCAGGPTVADYDFDGVFEVYMGDRVLIPWGMGMRSWWAANLTSRWNQTRVVCSSQVPTLIDVNGDGKLEVIANNVVNQGFAVLNASNGNLLEPQTLYNYLPSHRPYIPDIPSHSAPTVYDIDRDGNLEIMFSVSRPEVLQDFVIFELLGSQRGHIEARIDLSGYNSWCAWPPTVGDVNGDGIMEIIAAIGTEPLYGDSTKDFPILIYDSPAPDTYRLIAETYARGAGCLTYARVQDIDGDGLNEVVVAGVNGKVLAYDTVASTPQPRPRTEVQDYSEYKRGVAEYVEPPGPAKPLLRDEYPSSGSSDLPGNPTLSISAYDFQNDLMTITFSTNASGKWQNIGTYAGGNGIYNQPISNMDQYGIAYFWAVNATDNKGHSTYHTYTFTTKPWWNKSWHYRKMVTIDHTKVTSNLSNFPVLIDITDSDLAIHAQKNGDDIVFIALSGNKLNHEIDLFDKVSGHLVAWVMIPTLSSTKDTVLYMYYGNAHCSNQENPETVWDSDFIAVYHLGEESGNVTDSTIKNNDATFTRINAYQAPGRIGNAIDFDAVDDYIQLPRILSTETRFTFSAWIKASVGARYFISQWTNNRGAFLQVYGNTVEFYINGLRVATKPITLNEWHYVVGTFDGTTAKLYVDGGSPSGTTASSPSWPSQSMFLADRSDHFRKYKGFLDEVRISNASRSSAWIVTEYNNQRNPSLFCAIGNLEHSNTPPTASEVTLTPIDPRTDKDLIGHYVYEDLDGDSESGTEIRWYRNAQLQPDLNDTLIVPDHLTAKGETWYFTVTPCDGDRYGNTVASNAVTILNSPPSIDWYTPESETPTVNEGETLEFKHTSSDPDNDPLSYTWYLDSTEVAYTQNWTYSPDYYAAGHHNVTLAVSDGEFIVAKQWVVTVTNVNQAPVIDSWDPYENSMTIFENESQTFSITYHDPDGDSLTVQWFVDDILTATGDTFTFKATFDDTGTYNITVLVTDLSLASTTHEWTLSVEHVNRPPTIATYTPASLNPEVYEGASLEFTHTSSDPDGDALYYSWLLDDVLQATTQNWTYMPGYDEAGFHNVTLIVSDGQASARINWNVTVIDVNRSPSAPAIEISPSEPKTDDSLFCTITTPSVDADGDPVTYVYQWYRDDALQPELTTDTVPNQLTTKGEKWKCIVTPFDGKDYGIPVEAEVTIQNSSPTIDTFAPTEAEPIVNEGETLEFTQTSSDLDNDPLFYTWLLDSVEVAYTQNWTYNPGFDAAGYHNATLAVSDGQLETTLQWNITVIDVNRPPTAPTIEITPTPTYTVDDLNCTIKYQSPDPDGDSIIYIYQWYKDGILQPELTGNTVPNQLTNKTETWKCIVTPYDGKDYGPQAEAQATILDSPPHIDTYTPLVTSPSVNEGKNLEFTQTSSDPDNDVLTYQWELDFVFQSADQNWTYAPDYNSAGTHNVTLVVSDGVSTVTHYWNVSVIDVNSAPIIQTYYPETNPTIYEGQSQEFNVSSSDPDRDILTIEWWVNGSARCKTKQCL